MRLLKLDHLDNIELTDDLINDVPPYAILSHTWGTEGDEVTFSDLQSASGRSKAGFRKIIFCSIRARKDGLQYFWLDTCCIDKANHTELSEAITSMYRWYQNAEKCYVFMSDVSLVAATTQDEQTWKADFRRSRWFTRGWTLQELIAPRVVEFFSTQGTYLGNKSSLERSIHEVTTIPIKTLRGGSLSEVSVAERFRWAEKRSTTRKEDKAYSLLGVFNVYIPLIYGEGDNAFRRLEEEINKFSGVSSTNLSPSIVTECLQAFSSDVDCLSQKNRNEVCVPDTGQWFFGHPKHEEFCASDESRLLFVTAEAGSGKSTMMRTLVDSLQNSQFSPLIAYFFFKDDNDLQRSYGECLSAIIHQLLTQRPSLSKYARIPVQQFGRSIKHQLGEMWNLLIHFGTDAGTKIICVVDAVDECETSGRTQLLRDLEGHFALAASASSHLKFVVSSRPYQNLYHPYEDLISCSSKIHHLDGENAKFGADIVKVIEYRVNDLIRRRHLSDVTGRMLYDKVVAKNVRTKSFLWVKLAFELLSTDPRLHKGAGERTIEIILATIPESIGEQFERLLQSSSDPEHAQKILSVILTARRPLKIVELKVVYGLTQGLGNGMTPPKSYKDLEMLEDDDNFKTLLRNTCGLFITFVKNSVHLFHQTAREYLIVESANVEGATDHQSGASGDTAPAAKGVGTWKWSFTTAKANYITAKICLDLCCFDAPEDWIWKVFSNFATDDFRDAIQNYSQPLPFLTYAACNWYEHLTLSGNYVRPDDCVRDNATMFDVSKTHFWVWFLNACEQVCIRSTTSARWKVEIFASLWQIEGLSPSTDIDRGTFLREMCLQRLCPMDAKVNALFFDNLSTLPVSGIINGLEFTATAGYHFIDAFHLANGDWKHTSMSKAISALEHDDQLASRHLVENISKPVLLWTSMMDGQPTAFRKALTLAKNSEWLDNVPEYMLNYRGKQPGLLSSPDSAREADRDRQRKWNEQYPGTFDMIVRASTLPNADEVFVALADWIEISPGCRDIAEAVWKAGGFLNPKLCRRLISSGATVDSQFWRDKMTALHVAATFWEHDVVETLLDLGADALILSPNGYNALHWFCFAQGGPMEEKNKKRFSHRYAKVRIKSSLTRMVKSVTEKHRLIEQRDSEGITPLMLSVNCSPTMTRCLLDEGAMVNQTDISGRTALMHFFIGSGYIFKRKSILIALLRSGADARLADSEGTTAVGYWAQQVLSTELAHFYPGYNAHNMNFHQLDTLGVLAKEHAMARYLEPCHIPLTTATRLGNAQLCQYLLHTGAAANEHGIVNESPMARNGGSLSSDLQDLAWNPLLIAVFTRAYVTAALLIENYADVRFKVSEIDSMYEWRLPKVGTTSLHVLTAGNFTVWDGYWYTSQMAMATGSSVTGCSFEPVGNPDRSVHTKSLDERVMGIQRDATKGGDSDLGDSDLEQETIRSGPINDSRGSKLLPFDNFTRRLNTTATSNESLFNKIYDKDSTLSQRQHNLMELILKRGVDSNSMTRENITPVLVCARIGELGLAKLLVQYGADTNIPASDGCTALMWTARRGDKDMTEFLIDAGANVNAQLTISDPETDTCFRFESRRPLSYDYCRATLTPLALAAERGHYNVVELLLNRGADPNLKIEHHAHGKLRAKDWKRRMNYKRATKRAQRNLEPLDSDVDSDPEPEVWKGYQSVGTALSWARGEVRELLLRRGADTAVEEPIRECDCEVQERFYESDST